MSEMLGNQYFMARNYVGAQHEFEDCLEKSPEDLSIIKKLIICYTQTGHISKALKYFSRVINDNISIIVETEPIKEDCPCPELVGNLERNNAFNTGSFDYFVVLGIIWLYCDAKKSLEYFLKARNLNSARIEIHTIIESLNNHINKSNLFS